MCTRRSAVDGSMGIATATAGAMNRNAKVLMWVGLQKCKRGDDGDGEGGDNDEKTNTGEKESGRVNERISR